MKQNTMFPNLIQKFITDEIVTFLRGLIGYQDTARKLTVGKLIEYLVIAVDVLKDKTGPSDTFLITCGLSAHAINRHLTLDLVRCIDEIFARVFCAQ